MTTFPFTFPAVFGEDTGPRMPPTTYVPGKSPRIISDEQIVSIHTAQGVQLHQFLADDQTTMKWTREQRQISTCDLVVPASPRLSVTDFTPWLHHVSVWNDKGDELYWSGPIQRVEGNRNTITLSSRDVSSLGSRTRNPLNQRWDAADPAIIAAEAWDALIQHHNLTTKPIVRVDPEGKPFDYQAKADEKMIAAVWDELVDLGLYWTIVSGVPILGPAPKRAIVSLGEEHFVDGGLGLVRDGASSYNNVLLRGADNIARARCEMGGLDLQAIVAIDNVFGVSNANRAAEQLVQYSGAIHDTLFVPDGARLDPHAPISIGQMLPSVRVVIEAFGLLFTMELTKVTVNVAQGQSQVGVSFTSVNDNLPELLNSDGVQIT